MKTEREYLNELRFEALDLLKSKLQSEDNAVSLRAAEIVFTIKARRDVPTKKRMPRSFRPKQK